jgi:hypothetical protein
MRVAENGQSVGREGQGSIKRGLERSVILARQSVHEIEVDRLYARRAKEIGSATDIRFRLNAADGSLQFRIERLHPQTWSRLYRPSPMPNPPRSRADRVPPTALRRRSGRR